VLGIASTRSARACDSERRVRRECWSGSIREMAQGGPPLLVFPSGVYFGQRPEWRSTIQAHRRPTDLPLIRLSVWARRRSSYPLATVRRSSTRCRGCARSRTVSNPQLHERHIRCCSRAPRCHVLTSTAPGDGSLVLGCNASLGKRLGYRRFARQLWRAVQENTRRARRVNDASGRPRGVLQRAFGRHAQPHERALVLLEAAARRGAAPLVKLPQAEIERIRTA